MGENNFSRNQCVRALARLGFTLNNRRHGQYDKYDVPSGYQKNLPATVPPFIMIPRHKELRLQNKIVKEIELIGGLDMVEKFRRYL
ncbi:MAG: hypothetical protein NTV81_02140 [Candidatus Komeilibacteria bacterium]|nr:hypothetical protein [Candidatus Komeilibacteria bacterium]